VDFRRNASARTPERLILLPSFAPAAETWARTTVESNICTRWALSLIWASASKKASNTPDWLSRQKRFQTLFQWPKSRGSARQVMLWTVSDSEEIPVTFQWLSILRHFGVRIFYMQPDILPFYINNL
jgi:hypothetical protein